MWYAIKIYTSLSQNVSGIVKRNKSTLYDTVLHNQKHNTDSECSKKELEIHSGLKQQISNSKYAISMIRDLQLGCPIVYNLRAMEIVWGLDGIK